MSEEKKPVTLSLFGRTDVGQIREHNEDNFIVANLARNLRGLREENRTPHVEAGGLLLGVCDGMGGAAAGEVASQMAVDLVFEQMSTGGFASERDDLARRLVHSIEYAGAQIFKEARADRTRRGMGTTATIGALLDRRLFVGQVGDSRAYLLRGGKLLQLTRDQSLVNQLIEAGQLTEEEAETFEHNNIILQALGTAETVQVDLTYVDLCRGDVLMMCSDGLSGMIRNDEILAVLTTMESPLDACRELTDRANAAGGHDNITVIVARVDDGAPEPTPEDTFGYQKYALPELSDADAAAPADAQKERGYNTLHAVPHPSEMSATPSSGSPSLKVGHTMIGKMSPELEESVRAAEAQRKPAASRVSPGPSPEARGKLPSFEDPVELPTHELPGALVTVLVTSAILLVALAGYLATR